MKRQDFLPKAVAALYEFFPEAEVKTWNNLVKFRQNGFHGSMAFLPSEDPDTGCVKLVIELKHKGTTAEVKNPRLAMKNVRKYIRKFMYFGDDGKMLV